MKAVQIHRHGDVHALTYADIDEPNIQSPDQVIVRIKAAALNRADLAIRQGLTDAKISFPHILGSDGAGIIATIGANVKNLEPGDAVCLYPLTGCGGCEFCATDRELLCAGISVLGEQQHGTYTDYLRVPARNCFPIPPKLSFEEAAALPLVFLAAWRMLVIDAQLKPGEWLLIRSVGGGVATAALQIAGHLGAQVIVSSSNRAKIDAAKRCGAKYGINSRNTDVAQAVREITGKRGVDVVVDNAGGPSWPRSLAALAKGGRLATCGATAGASPQTDLRRVFWNHLKIFGSRFGSRADFLQVLSFVAASKTKPIIDRVFELKDAAQAHQRMEAGKSFGKIVLRIDN
ncbi:MAG: zinc-binding dehydrogenase [Candidatus Binatia bacterium]